jgi:hypothetical protein
MHTKYYSQNSRGRESLEDLSTDDRKTLKPILKKQSVTLALEMKQ